MPALDFSVNFWGVRGSVPAPRLSHMEVGGNTCCVEVRCGGRMLLFDAGTGAHAAGMAFTEEGVTDLDIFFTHCHYDHIYGLPFFDPLYVENNDVRIWAGHFLDGTSCKQMVKGFMSPPYFPVGPDCLKAAIDFRDFSAGDTLDLGDGIVIRTIRLNHPGGAVGYRVEYDNRALCLITDHEHTSDTPDPALVAFIKDAGIVIYDATYTEAEYAHFAGYGHSTWQHGARLCKAANAKTFVIYHHRSEHDDTILGTIEDDARKVFTGSVLARERQRLHVT